MLRVGYYQFRPVFGEVETNRKKVVQKLLKAEADLLVLPELPFTGYNFADKEELLPLAENLQNSLTVYQLAEVCARKDFYLVTGFAERQGDAVYNSALLIGPEGLVHSYRKLHLFFREKEIFEPGDIPIQVQEVKGVKIGMMICFDWIFPEVSRSLALLVAQIICHPSNLVLSHCQQAMPTRCLENGVFAVTANRFGSENRPHGGLRFTGKSQVVSPEAKVLHRAKSQQEELLIIEIDPARALNKKMTEFNDLFNDRRPGYYGEICSS